MVSNLGLPLAKRICRITTHLLTISLDRLRTNERSPFTNLILASNYLRPNVQLQEQITAFLNGADITMKYANENKTTRSSFRMIRITFRSPVETHQVELPRSLKLIDPWEIAFRLSKGRYPDYELRHRNARVPATQEPIVNVIQLPICIHCTGRGSFEKQ